ncbi:MAG: formylglycine-generating enzyme family protein [Anaerolineales bacterium]
MARIYPLLILFLAVGGARPALAQEDFTYETAELAAGEVILQHPTGWEVRYEESGTLRLVQLSNWEAWLLASQSNSAVQQQPGPGEYVVTLWMLPQDQLGVSLTSGAPAEDVLLDVANQFAAQLFDGPSPLGDFTRVTAPNGGELVVAQGSVGDGGAVLGVRQQGRAVIAGLAVTAPDNLASGRNVLLRVLPSVQINAPMTGEVAVQSGLQDEIGPEAPAAGPEVMSQDTTAETPREGAFFEDGLGRNADNPVTANAQWASIIEDIEGVPMALVPAGCFMMGTDAGAHDEGPVHEQCFDAPFWLDETEVSQAMYAECVAAEACRALPTSEDPDEPITGLTWYQAGAYCAWRGARLPTEPEWEYAARGPDGQRYPWGDEFAAANLAPGLAPVGSLAENASWVGARDMSGNAQEWVGSAYAAYPYEADDGREDPAGEGVRVLRGGSIQHSPEGLQATARRWLYPYGVSQTGGVRCALPY